MALVWGSCRKLDTPFVVDEDNIMLYLEKSEDGHELFRNKGLYSDSPYTLVGDTATYRLLVDSVVRKTELNMTPKGGPFKDYNLGTGPTLRDAELVVDDIFHGRVLRIAGIDTVVTPRTWGLTRKGFFIKLGADDQPFVGWKLWAFNGGFDQLLNETEFLFRRPSGSPFSYVWTQKDTLRTFHILSNGDSIRNIDGDPIRYETEFRYIRLDKTPILNKGEKLILSENIPQFSVEVLANGRMSTGYDVQSILRPDFQYYIDTIRTSASNTYHWNVLTFMEKRTRVEQGITYVWYIHWCVPYRVAQ